MELQRLIWGSGFDEIVPASILNISKKVGGVTAGAFSVDGLMIGFVYGITGVREGKLTHWSHMLGVMPSYRGRGVGRRLKHFQRDRLLERGVKEMRWTFDPLVAGNAHFNMNLLGVQIHDYVTDMYGNTGSGIHSFGTDRFVAHWDLGAPPGDDLPPQGQGVGEGPSMAGAASVDWDAAPIVNPVAGGTPAAAPSAPAIRIRIPPDILALNSSDPLAAGAWRTETRTAFKAARDAGYRIVGFSRTDDTVCPVYHLAREDAHQGGEPSASDRSLPREPGGGQS
ncbi:MAG: GNAT family N-acetyltransferase [Gemmatimonadota bacterium]